MSFSKYPKYKESGVEWLGQVPDHWEVKRISHVGELIAGFAFPSEKFSFFPECGIRLVRGDNVTEGWLRWGEKGRYWPFDLEYDPRYLLAKDDIVIQMDGSKVGKNWAYINSDDLPALLVQRVTRVRVTEYYPKYIYALISNNIFIGYIDQIKTDPAIPHITMKNIGDYKICIPPLPEQIAIASFLDRETTKIDALVAEQKRLIELLKEKRQAVISHAVTKGLNPNAKMKPSGIEWLGDVPEGWEVKKVKHLVDFPSGIQMGPFGGMLLGLSTSDTGFKVFGQENTMAGDFSLGGRWVTEERYHDLKNYQVQPGDILLTRKGSLGNALLVIKLPQPGIIDSDTIRLRINSNIINKHLFRLLMHEALYVAEQINLLKRGAILPGLNSQTIANLTILLPPIAKQEALISYLGTETAKFDTLITEAQRAIDLLQERRSALISAAVTGQIDVRGLVPSEAT